MSIVGIFRWILRLFSTPAAPAVVGISFRATEPGMSNDLQGQFVVSAPPSGVSQQLATYTVNGNPGGVVPVSTEIACATGDTISGTVVNISAGGVASAPSAVFTIKAVDNTTVPAAPTVTGMTFTPAPAPAPPPSS